MIEHIHVRNFAVARDVEVDLHPGLTVFTGETGSGKSLVVDALGFAFGARVGREVIATGAERAVVTVELGEGCTIERAVGLSGRSSASVDGAASTIEALRSLGERHIEIHGQAGQLSLLKPATQLDVLDRYGDHAATVEEVAGLVRQLRDTRRRLESLRTDAKERERLLDRLRYEVDEIEAAALAPGEDEVLRAEQQRLAGADALRMHAAEASAALDSEPVERSLSALRAIGEADDTAGELNDLALLLESTADELRRQLRAYADNLEEDPERLATVSERLDLVARLKRKYGESIDAVLAYARTAAEQLASFGGEEEDADALARRERELVGRAATAAEALSAARRVAAARLVAETRRELEGLGMGGAALAIGFECRDADGGLDVALPDFERIDGEAARNRAPFERAPRAFTEGGVDRVEFLASFNPGMPARPLAEIASGGETSRFLLALTAVFGNAAPPRTIVLDEVDEGVGGRAGAVVGKALARLARRHQVLCITHLPQVAAYGDHHLVVEKQTDGKTTWSTVHEVDGGARLAELASMLGGGSDENLAVARSLLATTAERRG